MRLTAGLDEGPVCLMDREPIHPDDDYGTLAARLQRLGGELLVRALGERPPFREQPPDGVTYAEKITAADRDLDPARPPEELERVVRALRPHVGARVSLPGGERLGVWAARVAGGSGPLRVEEGALRFGGLELLEVQPPGGRRMAASDWLRGRPAL
jgi:methionyl-tRNA formyltransferase